MQFIKGQPVNWAALKYIIFLFLKRHNMNNRTQKKKLNVKPVFITLLILITFTVILVFVFAGSGRKNVRISDYVTFSYSGVNGVGVLNYTIDTDRLYRDIAGDEKNAVLLKNIDMLVDGIKVVPDRSSKLSNGEEIKVKIEYDAALAEKVECRITGTEYVITADGLGNGAIVDAFSNIDVVVAGISPVAYANVVNKWQDEYFKNVSFSIDKSTGIALGDVITVTCEADDAELANMGVSILEKTKEYKVDRVDSYVKSVEQLNMQVIEELISDCKNTIKTETEDLTFRMLYKASRDSAYLFQYNNEWVNDTVLADARFLYRLDNHDVRQMNYIELIFKSDISNGASNMDVYFIFEFADSVITADGTFQISRNDLKNKYVCGTDYNDLFGRVVLSKENSYAISQITGLN